MKFEIQLFAAAREITGQARWPIDVPEGSTVADLKSQLVQNCPKLESMAKVLLVAVNNQYSGDSRVLTADDSIACFPPVSGG
ncbi:MAG: MoaD/ThiS family protein [Planctomycetaceae bacterium]|jgi:molybdopterin converting factor subunit 1